MITGDKQILACLFAHECIIVGEEGSELCRSVGEDFEDIRQKAALLGKRRVLHTHCRTVEQCSNAERVHVVACTFDSTSSMSSTMSLGSSLLLGTG